jgi:hypothetical protein
MNKRFWVARGMAAMALIGAIEANSFASIKTVRLEVKERVSSTGAFFLSTVNAGTAFLVGEVIRNELPNISRVIQACKSGIKGTTSSMVMSGMKGGQATGGPASVEFAIARIKDDSPAFDKAMFIKSDQQGKYKVALPPGKYWIGPKAKALDPMNYVPGAVSFPEKVVLVKEGTFTNIDLSQVGYAP